MNLNLLILLLIPLCVVLITKFISKEALTGKEILVQAIVPVILVACVWSISRYSMMADTEILNGKVTGKDKVWTSCSHSYQCNCRTVTSGSGSNRTTSTECDTCYEHSNDWDWTVYTTLGNFDVDRIDRRGSDEPPRWSIVTAGQPMALEHSYTNYVQAAPDSLFHFTNGKLYKGPLPVYPRVYNYQYLDHVITLGASVPDLSVWNAQMADALRDLGRQKQVNVTVILTNKKPMFADAVRAHWLGGKKNDVTVIIGTAYPTIRWVRVFSWSKQDIVNVALRNTLMDSKTLDPVTTTQIITKTITQYYERRPMAEFEYLADEAIPPTWVFILSIILGLGSAIGLGIYFHHNDPFDTPRRRFRY